MLKKYKHFSFDLDGTLIHTTPEYWHAIVHEIVEKLGGKIKEKYSINKFWFEPNRDETIKNEFNLDPDDFWKMFETLDQAHNRIMHTRPYDDAEKTLRKLKEMNKIISIVTNAPHRIAEMEIKKLNEAPYDFYLSVVDSKFEQKPNPASLHFVLNELEISPEETLYIGNSNEDAYYAKNAGVDFLHIERKEHKFDLKDYAIKIIHSLEELFN